MILKIIITLSFPQLYVGNENVNQVSDFIRK